MGHIVGHLIKTYLAYAAEKCNKLDCWELESKLTLGQVIFLILLILLKAEVYLA